MNYAELDAGKFWHFKDERYDTARSLGYTHLSEMIHQLYLKLGDTYKVAETVGMTRGGICGNLRYMGVKLNSRGGKHFTKLNNELVTKLRSEWDGVGAENHYFERFMKDTGLKMSYVGLRSALKGVTWADVVVPCQA